MNNHESLVYWSDESQLMGYGESDSSGCWLKFQIHSEDMDKFRGLKGTVFHLTLVKIQDNGEPEKTKEALKPEKLSKPYSQLASLLYKRGFFHTMVDDHFVVCEAVGTPEQFLEWVRQQPCAKTGKFDYNKDEATGTTIERCEAAHYNGDSPGKGIKADYSAIPLVHAWHEAEHKYGYSALDIFNRFPPTVNLNMNITGSEANRRNFADAEARGRDWMRAQAAKYRQEWAKEILLKRLSISTCANMDFVNYYQGFGDVQPVILHYWAKAHNLEWALPEGYRDGT